MNCCLCLKHSARHCFYPHIKTAVSAFCLRRSFPSSHEFIIQDGIWFFTEKKLRTIFVHSSVCRKSLFLKLTSDLLSLSPCPLSPGKGVNTGTDVPATRLGATPQTPFLITIEVFRQSELRTIFVRS